MTTLTDAQQRMLKAREARLKPADGRTLVCPTHSESRITLYLGPKAKAWCRCGKLMRPEEGVKNNASA